MSASGLSRASSGKRASFMDPTASSAVKEREKATPSRQPSARSNVSAVPTTGGGSSPRSDNAKTIESFLQDARNAVGIGSPGAGSPGYSPRMGSRAQSPPSPGPRGAERSRSVSPGRPERTANRAASSTKLRWNAPLPGDTLARGAKAPGSPGTPAVFSAGTLGADGRFAGPFGGVGSYAHSPALSPAHALARAAHARFDPNVDPALRFGVKNLGGNPAVATSLLPTFGPSALFGGTSGGISGATFGDVFSRERAASLTQFREAALMRDQIRAEGGLSRDGLGADTAAKAEIERLEAAVAELASEVRAFRAGKAETKTKNKKRRNKETAARRRREHGEPPRASAARDDDSDDSDDSDDDLENHLEKDENVSDDENENVSDDRRRTDARSDRGAIRSVGMSPASSSRSLDALVRNGRAADPSKLGSLIRAATLNASRESFLSEAADETETRRELPKKSVEAAADLRRASPDRAGRYLRTTRRDAEAARYARGLKQHSGSRASEFWGEGRGAVQGGGPVGGGVDGADEGGVLSDADRFEKTREREEIPSPTIANRREPKATKGETDAVSDAVSGDGFANRDDSRINRDSRIAEDAAAAFAAALSAVDARRAARPDPAATIARLTERNRALRRELGVAQRLMTGYHAQLMTGGAAFNTFTDRFSRRPFEAPPRENVDSRSAKLQFQSGPHANSPLASLRSTRRAESKRIAAELAVLRAERAFAETAAEADAAGLGVKPSRADADESETECSYEHFAKQSARLEGVARIAEEITALKETVAGLVRRMDADTRTRFSAREEELERSSRGALETTRSRSFAKRSEGNDGETGNGDAMIADERGTNANAAAAVHSPSFAESRFAGESLGERLGESLDGTVHETRANPRESATKARRKRDKDAIPASENSFAFDDDDDDDANGANERSRRDSVTSVVARTPPTTPPTPRSPPTPFASSPAMSLETDTAFLQTPAGPSPSPSGGAAESRRADAP